MSQKITIRDGFSTINYSQKGDGEITLLCIHGWCINHTYWQQTLDVFGAEYSVYAMDLPGFGESTSVREEWTVAEYAKDVLGLMDALKLKNVILVGHSMGGEIILEAAMMGHPELIGLIGIDNFKFVDVEWPEEERQKLMHSFELLKEDFRGYAPQYAEQMLFHPETPEAAATRIKSDFANTDPVVGYASIMDYIIVSGQSAPKLEKLDYKLHILNCEGVPIHIAGLQNRCKSGVEVKSITGSGHYPMIEKPAEFNAVLGELIRGAITASF